MSAEMQLVHEDLALAREAGARAVLSVEAKLYQSSSMLCYREAALSAEVRLLREELASAQEAAASAAGHAKQYQALATSSDEALRSMQVRRRSCKRGLLARLFCFICERQCVDFGDRDWFRSFRSYCMTAPLEHTTEAGYLSAFMDLRCHAAAQKEHEQVTG